MKKIVYSTQFFHDFYLLNSHSYVKFIPLIIDLNKKQCINDCMSKGSNYRLQR